MGSSKHTEKPSPAETLKKYIESMRALYHLTNEIPDTQQAFNSDERLKRALKGLQDLDLTTLDPYRMVSLKDWIQHVPNVKKIKTGENRSIFFDRDLIFDIEKLRYLQEIDFSKAKLASDLSHPSSYKNPLDRLLQIRIMRMDIYTDLSLSITLTNATYKEDYRSEYKDVTPEIIQERIKQLKKMPNGLLSKGLKIIIGDKTIIVE